tara:strand:+ start:1012 stop:1260 length:249 start_codon:yes stop_codon:yes gene_type:complete
MGLIIFLFWLMVFYYLSRFILRLFAPFMITYLTKKAKSKYTKSSRKPSFTKKPGEVSIDKMPKKNKPSNSNVGDYIDYEEVE